MSLLSRHHERLRFILHYGVLPWGIIAGLLAAVAGGIETARSASSTAPVGAEAIGVAALCFVVWSGVVGWAIGAVRWEMRNARHQAATPEPPARRRR